MWSPMGMIYRATYNENESNGELAVACQVLVVQALVYYDFKRQQSRAMTFSMHLSQRDRLFWSQLNTRDTARCRCTKD